MQLPSNPCGSTAVANDLIRLDHTRPHMTKPT